MKLDEFCKGIKLPEDAVKILMELQISEEKRKLKRQIFRGNRERFYKEVLAEENPAMHFLYYYCCFALETYEDYRKAGIKEEVFWDTFRDIAIWYDDCLTEHGVGGLMEYEWFYRHIEMKIFRFGRLQFEAAESDFELKGETVTLHKGDPVINVHIPRDGVLDYRECKASFCQALSYWGTDRIFMCESWLLWPMLKEMLPEESNILKFQSFFHILGTEPEEHDAERRIFGKFRKDKNAYPENTSLQKKVKKYLLSGKKMENGIGILRRVVL